MSLIIAVDFDGTLVDHRYPDIGQPVPNALEWLKRWQELEAKIILWTMRCNRVHEGNFSLLDAQSWLLERGIIPLGINENPEQENWTSSPKAYAHLYVDDAAYGCPLYQPPGFARPCVNWSIVGPGVEKLIKLRG